MISTERRPRRRRDHWVLGMVAWVTLLAAVALGGRALGQGALAPPALGKPGTWAGWASGRTPVEAAFAVLTLVVVALAWYLLAATVMVVVARLRGAGRLASVVDVLTVPVVRRSVHAVLGVGLMGTSVAGASATVGPGLLGPAWTAPAVELVVVTVADAAPGDAAPASDAPASDAPASDEDVPVMRMLPDESSAAPPVTAAPGDDAPDAPAAQAQLLSSEREVRPGDHLWSLAVQILRDAGAPAADDGDVVTYWRQLIEANLDRLADPENPDLIFPGQLLAVPTPPTGAPAA